MIQNTLFEALEGRYNATRQVGQYFAYDHLTGDARLASEACCQLAVSMLLTTPDSPELTVALRKLLEAKDAFVRAQFGSLLPIPAKETR
ncbi:hypothetical protein [Kribbella sp. NPDC023855]|uniref:hypothetical protein n=1 Tax=Kribbella sp. NPDC023855 TaxID=3154698 RepID=UPI0033ECF441